MSAGKWQSAQLGSLAEIERNSVSPEDIADGTHFVGLENIDGASGSVSTRQVAAGEIASTKFRFGPEHVLYGKLRPNLRKIGRCRTGGICSTDILPILPGQDLERDYLFHYLRQQAMVSLAAMRAPEANLPRLSPKILRTFPIRFPPLPEQRRIAAILDKADAIRRKRQQALELTDQFLRSAFLDLFGDPVTNPKGWPQRAVEEVCRVVRGSSPRPKADPRYYGGPVPRLMVADITRDGWFVTPGIDSLTEAGASLSRPLRRGTVVMVVSGDVGVVAMLEIDSCIHDGFVGFPDLEESIVLPEYFLLALHFLKATHEQRRAGSIWQNLTTHDIKQIRVAIPPLVIQEQSLRILAGFRNLRERETSTTRDTESLAGSLAQRAFRGGL